GFTRQNGHLLGFPKAAPSVRVEPSRRSTRGANAGTCFALVGSAFPVGCTARCVSRRRPMQTLRRTVAVLTLPAIAYLGAACERDTPTEAPPRPVATVGGPTCDVPADYATIQLAVNDPGCTTIDVAAGLYPETVTIPRTLTLNGAQANVDARTRAVPLASESVVGAPDGAFQIEGDKVVI